MSWLIKAASVPPRLWTPADITTALWLDAADSSTVTTVSGAISQWNDKSGNGRNFSQSNSSLRPIYSTAAQNGLNTVSINTLGQFLSYTSGGLFANISAGYMLMAASCTATTANTKVYFNIEAAPGFTRASQNKDVNNRFQSGGRRLNADPFVGINGSVDIGTTFNLLCSEFNYGSAVLTLFRNGTQEAQSSTFQTAGLTSDDGGNAALGNIVQGNTNNFTGLFCEIIVGHTSLSTNNRQRLEGYLAHKWGLTANLPNDHPFKNAAPTI